LRLVRVARSTYYYHKKEKPKENVVSEGRPIPGYSLLLNGIKVSDKQIQEWLMELIEGDGYAYGYRKLTVSLRRQYRLIINKKKVYRLCKELGILRPQRQKRTSYPRNIARNRLVTASNQLFETDIKYGYITGEDRFFFIQSCLDVFDRSIVAYHIGLSCEAKDVIRTIQAALFKRQLFDAEVKPVVRSDNGPQFISHAFRQACEQFKLEHERIPPKTPNLNAHIEAFHRLLQDECLSRFEFKTYGEAYEAVTEYISFYNERRIHSSLQDLSPNEFYLQNQKHLILTSTVRV
jgi:putative transposase